MSHDYDKDIIARLTEERDTWRSRSKHFQDLANEACEAVQRERAALAAANAQLEAIKNAYVGNGCDDNRLYQALNEVFGL